MYEKPMGITHGELLKPHWHLRKTPEIFIWFDLCQHLYCVTNTHTHILILIDGVGFINRNIQPSYVLDVSKYYLIMLKKEKHFWYDPFHFSSEFPFKNYMISIFCRKNLYSLYHTPNWCLMHIQFLYI